MAVVICLTVVNYYDTVNLNNKKGALDSKMLKHLLGTDYYGFTIGFYMELNRLDSLHNCVVV